MYNWWIFIGALISKYLFSKTLHIHIWGNFRTKLTNYHSNPNKNYLRIYSDVKLQALVLETGLYHKKVSPVVQSSEVQITTFLL